jgi:hypothetical protein
LIVTGAAPATGWETELLSVIVKNTHASAAIDLGGSGVTTGTGYSLAAGESITIGPLGGGDDLYGITASGTVVVSILAVT